ncbi:MAG: ATP phosphoribosyltransferase [Planctomycetota bacterium]|jgi:ATP phosphoribosyltransferase
MTLQIALPTGRMLKQAQPFLNSAGYEATEDLAKTRKLTVKSKCGRVEYLLVKPVDAPLYVEQGIADMGIAGKDVLMELQPDVLEPLDLGFSVCRLVLAGPPEINQDEQNRLAPIRVCSKFPVLAKHHFDKKGVPCTVFKLSGSVEIGAVLGLSDYIVDIVETGTTLRENGLIVHEELGHSSARLVVNRASWYDRHSEIKVLMDGLKQAIGGGSDD